MQKTETKNYLKTTSFRFSNETHKKLEELATQTKLSRAKVLETLVKNAKIKVEVTEK